MSAVLSLLCITASVLIGLTRFDLSEAASLILSAIAFLLAIAGQNKRPKVANALIALSVVSCFIAIASDKIH